MKAFQISFIKPFTYNNALKLQVLHKEKFKTSNLNI